MGIEPVKKINVSEQVYEQLKENLIDGTWSTREKIPSENELANMFHVSRVTVRQALSKLVALGLIETRLGEGNFVKEITIESYMKEMMPYVRQGNESIAEVLEFRLMLEVGAIEKACMKAQKEDIEYLKSSLARMVESQNDYQRYTQEDLHFHMILTKMVNNSMLTQVSYIVRNKIKDTIFSITKEIGVENGLLYHGKIIEAIQEKDGELAKSLMKEHLMESVQEYMKRS